MAAHQLLAALQPIVQRVRTDVSAIRGPKGVEWTREPLTEQRLLAHLGEGPARGVCPIKAGETTTMVGLLDFDSHKGESTWDEMAAAALRVADELEARFMAPVAFRSTGGNGIHLYVVWDAPQDAYSVRMLLMDALQAAGFTNGTGGVARGQVEVFPKQDGVALGRFGNQFFLPLAGKSEPLSMFDMEPVGKDLALLIQWVGSAPVPELARPTRSASSIGPVDRTLLDRALAAIPNTIDNRDDWFVLMCAYKEGGGDKEAARAWTMTHPSYTDEGFDGPWDSIKVGKENGTPVEYLFNVAQRHGFIEHIVNDFEVITTPTVDGEEPAQAKRKGIPEAQHLTTDQANAGRIVESFGRRLIVVAGQWYAWTGMRWEKDDGEVYRYACKLSKLIHAEADTWLAKATTSADEKERNAKIAEALTKWAQKSEMKASIEAAVGLAKKMLAVDEGQINRSPWLLNCINGTVDLRTGALLDHNPDDFITKLVPMAYDPSVRSEVWDAVLARVTLEEGMTTRPLVRFLQRWFGYCATGSTREQCFVVHYGQGSNGKSTVLDTIAEVLGDYAATAAPGLLVGNGKDRHPTEIADLFGRRMVTAHETGEGGHLKEDTVKQLTGGDKVKARFMRADFFEFPPTHKLQLLTNHKPIIKGSDNGIWRRVLLMPYLARWASSEEVAAGRAHFVKDTRIAERLKAEIQGVLTWVIEGARFWFQDGLQPPDAVMAASRDYQAEQDRVGQFVAECCELGADYQAPLGGGFGSLYDAYRTWCGDGGFHALSKMRFSQELERAAINTQKVAGKLPAAGGRRVDAVIFKGIRLVDGD